MWEGSLPGELRVGRPVRTGPAARPRAQGPGPSKTVLWWTEAVFTVWTPVSTLWRSLWASGGKGSTLISNASVRHRVALRCLFQSPV